MAKEMNLRSKKENVKPAAALMDKTNVENHKPNKRNKNKASPPPPAKTIFKKTEQIKEAQMRPRRALATVVSPDNESNIKSVATKILKEDVQLPKLATKSENPIKKRALLNKNLNKKQNKPRNGANIVEKHAVEGDCFGFNNSDLEQDPKPCETELTKFDCSKPYRLALYVKPSRTVRINPALAQKIQNLNPSLNLTNISMINTITPAKKRPASETMMSPNTTQFKVPFASTPLVVKKSAAKFVQPKITDIMKASPKKTRSGNAERQFKCYFENSSASEEEATPPPKVTKKVTEESICNNVTKTEDSIVPACRLKPSRRSYTKKSKPIEEPMEEEPASDEIIKSIEKTKKKGKSKKAEKEDEDFEKWSRSMNSMFSEVDQFEMSID